jgi:hypothetical protein
MPVFDDFLQASYAIIPIKIRGLFKSLCVGLFDAIFSSLKFGFHLPITFTNPPSDAALWPVSQTWASNAVNLRRPLRGTSGSHAFRAQSGGNSVPESCPLFLSRAR